MLKKQNRLKKDSSFRATFFQNRVVSDEFFVLYAGKNKEKEFYSTKVGFIVSKKVHKRAVVRNKIKRRLRDVVYKYLKESNPSFVSLIFKAKPNSVNSDYEITLKSVYKLLQRMANKSFHKV